MADSLTDRLGQIIRMCRRGAVWIHPAGYLNPAVLFG
jgi:hypothetical protein